MMLALKLVSSITKALITRRSTVCVDGVEDKAIHPDLLVRIFENNCELVPTTLSDHRYAPVTRKNLAIVNSLCYEWRYEQKHFLHNWSNCRYHNRAQTARHILAFTVTIFLAAAQSDVSVSL